MGFPTVRVGRASQTEDTLTRPYLIGRVCGCLRGRVSEKGAKADDRTIAL